MYTLRLTLMVALLAVVSIVLLPANLIALEVPPAPTAGPVLDQANILTPEQERSLSAKITDAEKATGNQVGILTIASLDNESIEEYSIKVARAWGIGSEQRNSGVLLLVAVEDRKMRIEVGYGLEGALPDIRANRIIQDRIRPAFQKNDYYGGINSGVDGILLAIQNETDPNLGTRTDQKPSANLPWEFLLIALFIIPSWLASLLGRSKSWWAGGVLGAVVGAIVVALIGLTVIGVAVLVILPLAGLLFDKVVSGNYRRRTGAGIAPSWWAGGTNWGGGSKDGWGGFGGGGFGGGGSSGDW